MIDIRAYVPALTRIGFGLVFAGSIVMGLEDGVTDKFDVTKAIACATAFGIWLFTELKDVAPLQPSVSDLKLYQEINETVGKMTLDYLNGANFHHSFRMANLAGVIHIADWHGTQYEFADTKIQARWSEVTQAVKEFVGYMNPNVSPTHNGELMTTKLHGYDDENQPQAVHDANEKLNRDAQKLYTLFNSFYKFARGQLGL